MITIRVSDISTWRYPSRSIHPKLFWANFKTGLYFPHLSLIKMKENVKYLFYVSQNKFRMTRRQFHSNLIITLQRHSNGHDSVSNHQPHGCLLNGWFSRRSKKTWKLRVAGLCVVNSLRTGEFPAQMASNAENASIWWCHQGNLAFLSI